MIIILSVSGPCAKVGLDAPGHAERACDDDRNIVSEYNAYDRVTCVCTI